MILGVHHFSFSVTDLNRTIDFYTRLLKVKLQSITINKYDSLGHALFGTKWGLNQERAELAIAVMDVGGEKGRVY